MTQKYYEFVVTDGPGTLIHHGVCDEWTLARVRYSVDWLHNVESEECSPDCETGQ